MYFPFFLVTDSEKAIIALSISTGDNLESNNLNKEAEGKKALSTLVLL